MANPVNAPTGTPTHPALPPLRRFVIVDPGGFPSTMFLQFLQQLANGQFTVSSGTITKEAFGATMLAVAPWSWLDAP